VAVVSVDVVATTQPVAGVQFFVSATGLLRLIAGGSPALVDATFTLAAPAGCSASPASPVTVQDRTVPPGADVSVTRTWNVTCAAAGDHLFSADVSAALDPSQGLSDANPANNANSGAITVSVLP
jgi:hypothetical protein